MLNYKTLFKKIKLKNYWLYIYIFLIISSFSLTYLLLIPDSELVKDKSNIIKILLLDTILVITLIGLTIRQVILIFINKKQNLSASKLYIKFINLFTLISLAPTIGVIVVASLFYNLELNTWFGAAVKNTIINSNIVANDYLKLKSENLEVNIESISRDIYNLMRVSKLAEKDISRLNLNHENKRLEDIFIFNSSNQILNFSGTDNTKNNFLAPTEAIYKILNSGKIYLTQKDKNILSAYYKLHFLNDAFLMINDDINETIYNHLFETAKAITAYNNLENNNSRIQISFSMIFVLFSICLLLIAILLGFRMAHKLSRPISNLINSSEKVSKGNFNAKVSEIDDSDEISMLLKSFNKMIVEIESQQKELIEKNVEIENRRLFTEAVLSSISTGVVALNKDFIINLSNKSFLQIINRSNTNIEGINFFEIFPELDHIKIKIIEKKFNELNQQIEFNINNNIRNLFINFTIEKINNNVIGYVVTIDDLTSLILAEKHAAWSDIARKIAHEIKNPLTPIKLSAERMEKKISENNIDKEVFTSLTRTISSQVDDIGKLIDEFSSFARLPKAVIQNNDFCEVLKDSYEFFSQSHTNINFKLISNIDELFCFFDKFQLSLVLNNILKNAVEAVYRIKNPFITVKLDIEDKFLHLHIIDNGLGIDMSIITKIFQPYFTTKEKGTGLGLSICKKIVEDHGGNISIKKNTSTGSTVTLSLLL